MVSIGMRMSKEQGTGINYLRAVMYLLALSLIAVGCKKKPPETATRQKKTSTTLLHNAPERGQSDVAELLRKHAVEDLPKANATKSQRFNDVADLVFTGETGGKQNFGDWIAVGDVNGDGYDDLLVSAALYNNEQGRVYLYYGGEGMDNNADRIFTGENAGDHFSDGGGYLADMNNDGFDDVIIGARYFNDRGRVYIYYGGQDIDVEPDVTVEPEEGVINSSFGRGMVTEDVNGDGYKDLIVSAPRFENLKGRAYLFYGGDPFDTTIDKIFTGEEIGDAFGHQISARGDVDGDGFNDILIGAYRSYGSEDIPGRVYLYFGVNGTDMDVVPDVIFEGENARDNFSCRLDLFDIDKDGYADVLISAREWGEGANTSQGRAYLYWGSSRKSMDNVADLTFTGETLANASFGGNTIYAGHVNNDPYGDIIIGSYNWYQRSRIGRAYLFYGGTKTSIDNKCDHIFDENKEPDTNYGKEAKLCDLNNDGLDDVVLGGYTYNNGQGRVWIYLNKPPLSK